MTQFSSLFPNQIWDGRTDHIKDTNEKKAPNYEDWQRLVTEITAVQESLLGQRKSYSGWEFVGGDNVIEIDNKNWTRIMVDGSRFSNAQLPPGVPRFWSVEDSEFVNFNQGDFYLIRFLADYDLRKRTEVDLRIRIVEPDFSVTVQVGTFKEGQYSCTIPYFIGGIVKDSEVVLEVKMRTGRGQLSRPNLLIYRHM